MLSLSGASGGISGRSKAEWGVKRAIPFTCELYCLKTNASWVSISENTTGATMNSATDINLTGASLIMDIGGHQIFHRDCSRVAERQGSVQDLASGLSAKC